MTSSRFGGRHCENEDNATAAADRGEMKEGGELLTGAGDAPLFPNGVPAVLTIALIALSSFLSIRFTVVIYASKESGADAFECNQ